MAEVDQVIISSQDVIRNTLTDIQDWRANHTDDEDDDGMFALVRQDFQNLTIQTFPQPIPGEGHVSYQSRVTSVVTPSLTNLQTNTEIALNTVNQNLQYEFDPTVRDFLSTNQVIFADAKVRFFTNLTASLPILCFTAYSMVMADEATRTALVPSFNSLLNGLYEPITIMISMAQACLDFLHERKKQQNAKKTIKDVSLVESEESKPTALLLPSSIVDENKTKIVPFSSDIPQAAALPKPPLNKTDSKSKEPKVKNVAECNQKSQAKSQANHAPPKPPKQDNIQANKNPPGLKNEKIPQPTSLPKPPLNNPVADPGLVQTNKKESKPQQFQNKAPQNSPTPPKEPQVKKVAECKQPTPVPSIHRTLPTPILQDNKKTGQCQQKPPPKSPPSPIGIWSQLKKMTNQMKTPEDKSLWNFGFEVIKFAITAIVIVGGFALLALARR